MVSARASHLESRTSDVKELMNSKWNSKSSEHSKGFHVSTVDCDGWIGQTIHRKDKLVYLSVFRDRETSGTRK